MSSLVLPPVNRPFVEALQHVAGTAGTWSVIGGFAVWCHLGESHRPTLDIDTAAASDAHETLVALGIPGNDDHRRIIEGVKLEIIEVLDPGAGATELDDKNRLFVTGHWAAASLSTDIEVHCEDLEVTVPVARRLPLIACKLHAWLDRRDQRAEKRGSDGLDIVQLLRTADWDSLAADARRQDAVDAVRSLPANDALDRPAEQVAAEVLARYVLHQPTLAIEDTTGAVNDQRVDVSGDHARAVFDRSRPVLIDGTRITFHAPYADMDEERLRDQILAMLGNVYGPATGESFSKRGKSDIFLPWEGGHPVFLAECKWWTGPKAFEEQALPQLLDRYVVWRDTHAAMILFIGNKDASAVIHKANEIVRSHPRYLRDGAPIEGSPVFVLHKDGDPDREIKLAVVSAAIHK